MTDETGTKPDPNAAAAGAERPAAPEAAPAAELTAKLEAEAADLKDRLLRAFAEMENIRRRNEREIADARQYAVTGFAREILSIGDNLRRTLDAVPAGAADAESGGLKALLEGVTVTEREFQKVLGKYGIRRIEPVGDRFDPNLHQAMYEVPTTNVPTGTVVEVVQAGYVLGERTLRPALVAVSKRGPKAAPSAPANDDRQSAEPRAGATDADSGGSGGA